MQALVVQVGLFAVTVSIVSSLILGTRRPPRWPFYLIAKVGMGIVVGIITLLVVPQPEVEAAPRAWAYLLGILLYAIGVIGVSRDILIRTAKGRVTATTVRFDALEERVGKEELRNTGIEEFAEETRRRAARHGEARKDEHEGKLDL